MYSTRLRLINPVQSFQLPWFGSVCEHHYFTAHTSNLSIPCEYMHARSTIKILTSCSLLVAGGRSSGNMSVLVHSMASIFLFLIGIFDSIVALLRRTLYKFLPIYHTHCAIVTEHATFQFWTLCNRFSGSIRMNRQSHPAWEKQGSAWSYKSALLQPSSFSDETVPWQVSVHLRTFSWHSRTWLGNRTSAGCDVCNDIDMVCIGMYVYIGENTGLLPGKLVVVFWCTFMPQLTSRYKKHRSRYQNPSTPQQYLSIAMSNAREQYAKTVIQRHHELRRKPHGRAERELPRPRQPVYRTPGTQSRSVS